ncbi:MAG: hypothetical protein FJ008_00975 [Chloroflexi bacterium]|nr:hypothetical protein [Chloroflexota bacterium]MBM3153887.1 hypothetical protein [Chloroflexota bacterium]MBM3172474.1 hypothetical protein [Chloroflexota bacterium]MBM3174848.1 hypothetical protein [Chloroflexota bacterium]MBM4449321.1 hypothetical protein [Chloroflexota bacterium]
MVLRCLWRFWAALGELCWCYYKLAAAGIGSNCHRSCRKISRHKQQVHHN